MLPAFPAIESAAELLLEIAEKNPAVVSVSTLKVISPAGAAPDVLALMLSPLSICRSSVCAVIVMAPGVLAALPPNITEVMPLMPTRLTWAAGLPAPLIPSIVMFPAVPAVDSVDELSLKIPALATVSVSTFKAMLPAGALPNVSAPMDALARSSVCAVIVMVAGVLAAVPPLIPVLIVLVELMPPSMRTWAAELPAPPIP